MPKIVSKRVIKHTTAASTKKNEEVKEVESIDFDFQPPKASDQLKQTIMSDAGFASAPVQPAALVKTTGSWGQKQIPKKDARKLKHEKFVSSFLMPGERVKKTGLESLSSSLTDVLNTVGSEGSHSKSKQFVPNDTTMKKLKKDQDNFKLVLEHSAFRANPMGTIKEHLQNEMAMMLIQEEQEQSMKNEKPMKKNNNKNNKNKKNNNRK